MATTTTYTGFTRVLDPTGGAAPWSVADITTATVTNGGTSYNTENVTYFLRGSNPASNGAISADYVVGTNGALFATDVINYLPTGGVIATFYGSESYNPLLAPPGFTPANPGYLYTQYTYAPGGGLAQVVAAQSNGHVYVGTGAVAV